MKNKIVLKKAAQAGLLIFAILIGTTALSWKNDVIRLALGSRAPASANSPLNVIAGSAQIVALEYEPWFGPGAASFSNAESIPILHSADMSIGYDSADPAVIQQHLQWFQYMGVDAVVMDLTNNANCMFRQGNACPSADFGNAMANMASNVAAIYKYWGSIGSPIKIIPMIDAAYSTTAGSDNGWENADGSTWASGQSQIPAVELELNFFGNLMQQYPELSVMYEGHPLVLAYIGTPVPSVQPALFNNWVSQHNIANSYTMRMIGGFLDAQPSVWAASSTYAPLHQISSSYNIWSWIDRQNAPYGNYPSYVMGNGYVEALNAAVATPGVSNGWTGADAALRNNGATFATAMAYASKIKPTFVTITQFNEFGKPDQGNDAQHSNDIEPAQAWGFSTLDAVALQVCLYKGGSQSACQARVNARKAGALPAIFSALLAN